MTSQKQIAKPKFPTNDMYAAVGPELKIAFHILEQGMEIKNNDIVYDNTKGMSWLSKMGRELEGEVSRATIDQYLDSLLDSRWLKHGKQEMQKVEDVDGTKWVRAYYLGNEYVPKIIGFYKLTHDLGGKPYEKKRQQSTTI